MRIVGVTSFGGPEKLQVLDVPEPHPGAGEVRIRIHAATVNATDIGLRKGYQGFPVPGRAEPYVPGMEAAGVISEVGDGVSWQVGDGVIAVAVATDPHGGAYADELVVAAESVVRMPARTDFAAAATLPMNGLTARTALDLLDLPTGSTVAVAGTVGAVGGYTVQLAKADGLHVIADSAEADEELVRRLGADRIVRRGEGFADRIRALVPNGVHGLVDAAVLDEAVVPAIRDHGALAVLRGWDGEPGRGITVGKVFVPQQVTNTAALDLLRQQVEDGVLTLRVARVFPAERAAEAHRLVEAGGLRGRVVLDFSR
jgi:NADPH:quinone reductase-like Zn-dependent oxidoreductase